MLYNVRILDWWILMAIFWPSENHLSSLYIIGIPSNQTYIEKHTKKIHIIKRLWFFFFSVYPSPFTYKSLQSTCSEVSCSIAAPIYSYRRDLYCLWLQPPRQNLSTEAWMGLAWRDIYGKEKVHSFPPSPCVLFCFFVFFFLFGVRSGIMLIIANHMRTSLLTISVTIIIWRSKLSPSLLMALMVSFQNLFLICPRWINNQSWKSVLRNTVRRSVCLLKFFCLT